MVLLQSDLRSAIQIASTFCYLKPIRSDNSPEPRLFARRPPPRLRLRALYAVERSGEKPSICTADELHYVSVDNSDWRLALWRYKPPPKAPPRNHPLLLLSGVGTNAIGFDLAPGSSFARFMSSQGFDTWILEFRGAGLSSEVKSGEVKKPVNAIADRSNSATMNKANGIYSTGLPSGIKSGSLTESDASSAQRTDMVTKSAESQLVMTFAETFKRLSERLSGVLNEGQRSVPPQFGDLLERFSSTIEDFQKQLNLIVKYNWDFDHYLEEDVPAAMDYIRRECKPKDGKLLAIGHSMGGILLYAMLSRKSCEGRDSGLASVITLGSSLDYTTSKSSLKALLPLADPAQALSVPVVPLGALLAAAHPLASRPPYVMSWLSPLISAQDMMDPELVEKLVFNNFCTVPAKLLLQLTTSFNKGGLCDRSGSFFYKDHLHKIDVPVLAIAGDQDLICPPEAVYETVKLMPEHLVTYKVFGEPGGPHYAHYDLVGGRLAGEQVYPFIVEFLSRHDLS